MKLSPLIVALDVESLSKVETLIQKLGPSVDFYKVGMKLYTRYGPDVLKLLRKKRKNIFLDLKFHDIPNTVAEACREATRHGVQMLTVHTSGGKEMLSAAAKAVRAESRRRGVSRPWVMGGPETGDDSPAGLLPGGRCHRGGSPHPPGPGPPQGSRGDSPRKILIISQPSAIPCDMNFTRIKGGYGFGFAHFFPCPWGKP